VQSQSIRPCCLYVLHHLAPLATNGPFDAHVIVEAGGGIERHRNLHVAAGCIVDRAGSQRWGCSSGNQFNGAHNLRRTPLAKIPSLVNTLLHRLLTGGRWFGVNTVGYTQNSAAPVPASTVVIVPKMRGCKLKSEDTRS